MTEQVKNPSHYCEGRKIETWDVCADWNLDFFLGNVVKYISRAGRKEDELTDLKKAREYLDKKIQMMEKEEIPPRYITITKRCGNCKWHNKNNTCALNIAVNRGVAYFGFGMAGCGDRVIYKTDDDVCESWDFDESRNI